MAEACLGLGGTVAIHAIGDLANDRVLDLFEALIRDGADPGRLRIEHASVLAAGAIDRMAALGVTASVQPAFLASEVEWLAQAIGPTGRQDLLHSEPWRRPGFRWSGARIARSKHQTHGKASPPPPVRVVWAPEVPSNFSASSLTEGMEADFLVIDRDPRTSPEIGATRVVASYRRGQPHRPGRRAAVPLIP